VITTDLSYFYRGQTLSSRLTGFYTRMMDLAEVNFFFTDSGYGSAFVQEVATGIDVLHKGLELGLEYELNPSVKLSAAMALGDYRYASQPEISLFSEPGNNPGDLGQGDGILSVGNAEVKGLKRAAGPSRAFSLGLHYRDPRYWWAGVTINHLAEHYTDLSFLRHTPGFWLDPETGQEVSGVGPGELKRALGQHSLPEANFLNLTGGKSWRRGTHYISLFISVSNLLDAFFLSGGFQQGRNGNYQQWYRDHLSGRPSFGPKYWPGYGRTYFMNLSWSFK
jgi:outer membrane receptor protein involved in Fe transport